ncbi:hypothetical protein ACIPPT_05895 [Wolbachia endosymbiont of Drosophila bicornuta]|nr:hypothetical protein [Wolbachia pipientis]
MICSDYCKKSYNSRMSTLFVIKDFYVFKYGSSGLLSEKYQ